VAFSPDGKTLVTTDTDGTIRQWNVATRRQIRAPIAPRSAPEFLREALSPNGKTLATTQFGGPAQLWDLRTGKRD
jgi:WD40 repeat protein